MVEPRRTPTAPKSSQAPDPVHHAVLHVFRQVAPDTPIEDRERFAIAISRRAGALRDAQLRAALDQVEAVGRAVPPSFQTLMVRQDGLVDLGGAVSLMALQGQKLEARWLEALKLLVETAREYRRAVEHLQSFAEIHPDERTAETEAILFMLGQIEGRIRALTPEQPPAPAKAQHAQRGSAT